MRASVSRGCLTTAVALLASAVAPAQQVWSATNQTELLAAIAAAAPGDVIQLAATGTFHQFSLPRGLTIRGPATITSQSGYTTDVRVPAGQIAQLVDLTFTTVSAPAGVVEIHGTARLDGCSASSLTLVNANAVIERCQFRGNFSSPGIDAQDSIVSIHGSTLIGSSARLNPFPEFAAPGIDMRSGSGSLHVSTSSVAGGDGFDDRPFSPFQTNPAPGIRANVPSWLSDTTVSGGAYAMGSGTAAVGLSALRAKAFTARCTISGGISGGVSAPPSQGQVFADPTLLGVRMTPLQRGQPASIDVLADQPGVPLAIFAQIGLNDPQLFPFITQPLWLSSAAVLVAAGLSGSNSQLSLAWQMLPDPTFENVSVSFVGIGLGGAGVQITPTAGGLIR